MEQNSVVISIDRHQELLEIEKDKNKPRSKSILIERGMLYNLRLETDDEVTEKLAIELKEARAEIKKQKEEMSDMIKKPSLEITIDDVKKMNYWDFRKWKKSQYCVQRIVYKQFLKSGIWKQESEKH